MKKKKNIKFNKYKFKRLSVEGVSVLLSWLIPMLIVILAALAFLALNEHTGSNELKPTKITDWIFLIAWFISPVVSVFFLIFNRKNGYKNITSLFMYPIALFIVSVVPLFISHPEARTAAAVRAGISNTKLYFIVFYVVLFVAYLVNLALSKSAFKKSNWWLFIATIPYMLTAFMVQKAQGSFIKFISLKDFEYSSVAKMMKVGHFNDVRLMNPLWYDTIGLIVASTILLIGVSLSAFIWKKTKKWRQKAKRQEEKAKQAKVQAS